MAITRLKLDKALGETSLLNRVVKVIAIITLERLRKLYLAYLRLGYYLEIFRRVVIVILKKLGKSDYLNLGVY